MKPATTIAAIALFSFIGNGKVISGQTTQKPPKTFVPPPVESPEHILARTNFESVKHQYEDSQKEYEERKQKEEHCQTFPVEHPVTSDSVDQSMVGCTYETRKSRFVMEGMSDALVHFRNQLNDVDMCLKTYNDTIDKKVSDQTTREVGRIKTCQSEDLYPPAAKH